MDKNRQLPIYLYAGPSAHLQVISIQQQPTATHGLPKVALLGEKPWVIALKTACHYVAATTSVAQL